MKIGDKVTYQGFAAPVWDKTSKTWSPVSSQHKEDGVYLGCTWRMNGKYMPPFAGGFSNASGMYEYPEPGFLDVSSSVKVLVIQPLDSSGRWRKPVLCFPEQVELQD